MKKLAYSIVLAPILAMIFVTIHVCIVMYKPYSGNENIFTIHSGEGFSSINYRLYKDGYISNPRIFHYYSRLTDSMTKFKAGSYEIPLRSNMLEVLNTLIEGKPILTTVTIPEGKNIYDVAQIFKDKNIISDPDEFIRATKDPEIMKQFGITNAPSVEGYLYPETYRFAPQTPPKTVVTTMLEQFKSATKDLDIKYPGMNAHEVITLASIVEKETGAPFERKTIAGIYHNRLKKKMRLQADPTTIYGMYHRDGKFNGNLKKSDLLEKTPYNTYKISGLPLGPICSPSIEAIKATLEPENHSFLYFVSKNDGTHIFTSTYKEHNAAVDQWQRVRSNRKGKSWRDLKKSER